MKVVMWRKEEILFIVSIILLNTNHLMKHPVLTIQYDDMQYYYSTINQKASMKASIYYV